MCRTRAKGEINGKSANLNNALKNIIYQEYITKPGQIPLGELVVVFDADMQVGTRHVAQVCRAGSCAVALIMTAQCDDECSDECSV